MAVEQVIRGADMLIIEGATARDAIDSSPFQCGDTVKITSIKVRHYGRDQWSVTYTFVKVDEPTSCKPDAQP